MAAHRKWFTKKNTEMSNLDETDLTIMNRAANCLRVGKEDAPTFQDLAAIRQLYKPGLSAQDLLELINEEKK